MESNNENNKRILNNLKLVFYQMKIRIQIDNNVSFISRSQSKSDKNYFTSLILSEIKKVIDGDCYGLSTPFLHSTNEPNDGIEKDKLIVFFDNEINLLNKLHQIDNDTLINYYHEFAKRLNNLIL